MYATSPSACLLRQASLSPEPEDGDKDVDVDLYQAAVLILAHLDRLAYQFIQPLKSVLSRNLRNFFLICDSFYCLYQDRIVTENTLVRLDLSATMVDRYTVVQKLPITIEQIVCTALGLLILSSDGKVHTICYNDQEPVSLVLFNFNCLNSHVFFEIFILFIH